MVKSKKKVQSSGFPGQAFGKFKWKKTDVVKDDVETKDEPEDSNESTDANECGSFQFFGQYTCDFSHIGGFEKRGTRGYKSTGFREKKKDISAPVPVCDSNPRFNLDRLQPKPKEEKWLKCFTSKVENFFKRNSKTTDQQMASRSPSSEREPIENNNGPLPANLVKEFRSDGSNVPTRDPFGGKPFAYSEEVDKPSDCDDSKTQAPVDKISSTSEKTPKKRPAETDPHPLESPTKVLKATLLQRHAPETNGTLKPLSPNRIAEDSGTTPAVDTSDDGSAKKRSDFRK